MYKAVVVSKLGHRDLDFSQIDWTSNKIQQNYHFMQPRLSEYANRLRVLIQMTKKNGAKAIFVSQPFRKCRNTQEGLEGDSKISHYDNYKFNGLDFYYMMKRLDAVTKMVAKENDVLFIDLASKIELDDDDFYDFIHMTPQGTLKVGELLWGTLKDQIVVD